MQQDALEGLSRHFAGTDGVGCGRGDGRVAGNLGGGFVLLAMVEDDRDQALGFYFGGLTE